MILVDGVMQWEWHYWWSRPSSELYGIELDPMARFQSVCNTLGSFKDP